MSALSPDDVTTVQQQELRLEQLTPLQQKALDFMTQRLQGLPCIHELSRGVTTSIRLLRFLRVAKWDCEAAWLAYADFVRFRQERRLDALTESMLAVNRRFFEQGCPLEKIHFHSCSERSELFYPRLFTRAAQNGGYEPLRDRHGNLLVCEAPGTANFEGGC